MNDHDYTFSATKVVGDGFSAVLYFKGKQIESATGLKSDKATRNWAVASAAVHKRNNTPDPHQGESHSIYGGFTL